VRRAVLVDEEDGVDGAARPLARVSACSAEGEGVRKGRSPILESGGPSARRAAGGGGGGAAGGRAHFSRSRSIRPCTELSFSNFGAFTPKEYWETWWSVIAL
jgi:hypothetical protein